jgi:hypothetical protein
MATWGEFASAAPALAAFGAGRFARGVAYLATVRKDGGPRVHPVTPILGGGRLFLFMEPTSPKGHDLRRDARYALHCAVEDASGGQGEFYLTGRARVSEDAATRALAVQSASYAPADRYILFELDVDSAASTVYDGGETQRQRWP